MRRSFVVLKLFKSSTNRPHPRLPLVAAYSRMLHDAFRLHSTSSATLNSCRNVTGCQEH